MKNITFKKLILLIGALLLVTGVSIFAYWMESINKPEDKEIEINIIVGIGGEDGTELKVQEVNGDFNFVPLGREQDSIGDNNKSSYVFDSNVRWEHTPENNKDQVGLLKAYVTNFIFYELEDPETSEGENYLSEEQLEELIGFFTVEIGSIVNGEFVPDDEFYLEPNIDTNTWDTIQIRITFAHEPTNKELRTLLLERKYDLILTLEIIHIKDV